MTFDEAKAIVQLMGFRIDERFSTGKNFVDVWRDNAVDLSTPRSPHHYPYRWLDMYPMHTQEEAETMFIKWVEEADAADGIVYNGTESKSRNNGWWFKKCGS